MHRPTDEQLALLEGFERRAFDIADAVNRRPTLKRASHAFLRTFGAGWVHHCTKHILQKRGLEHLTSLRPDRGVLVICNHRSFFDLYSVACVVLRNTTWVRGMYFPVRADFFYERPAGVAVNAIMSAMAMYPPVLRQPQKRAFNQYAVDFIADVVKTPGALVGFHPEGTRNKTADPYALLPANPGVGQIVYHARPIVLPVFVLGLGNDLPRQVMGNFTRRGEPITMVFGAPLDLASFYAEPARLRTYKQLADHLAGELVRLGATERELREKEGFPSKAPPQATAAAPRAEPGGG